MHRSTLKAAVLLAAVSLVMLSAGCQDPYLTGANIVLNKAPEDLTQDDYQQVIRNLKTAVEQGYPQNFSKYYSMLAHCYYYTGQYQLTRSSLDSAIKYNPEKADSLNKVLDSYWGLQFNIALEQLKRAASVSKDSAKAFVDKAQNNINNAVILNPQKIENTIIQANLYSLVGKSDEARGLYEKAAKISPNNADVHYQLGRIAYEAKDWDAAIVNLEKAVNLKQDNALWYYMLGEAYLYKKDFPKAQTAFQKSANLNPQDKDAWYNLGLAYFNEGRDIPAAVNAFEKVVALQSDDLSALEGLGLCYLVNLKDFDNAIRVYKTMVELRPDKVEYWTNLRYAYIQKGMKAEAAAVEKRIKQLK